MTYRESVLSFACEGEPLAGILAQPVTPGGDLGVLIIVGGPQYRAGSHRQFTLLARHLAAGGLPCLRFDYRSMGDSPGEARDFLGVDADIAAAIDALTGACPQVRRVVLWGLCDAASAALLYLQSRADARVAGLALANPWARSAATLAQTQIKHYYWQRLTQPDFWRKLLRGGVGLTAVKSLLANLRLARQGRAARPKGPGRPSSFQDRMALGWRDFPGRILLLLSGDDYTAKEFLLHAEASPAWQGLLASDRVQTTRFEAADHTFSDPAQTEAVNAATLGWLHSLSRSSP